MAPRLIPIAERLRGEIHTMHFGGSVRHVYNPLDYAWAAHCEYLRRAGQGNANALLVGMNAGYFGMAQTGVPFGDVVMVRDWIGIEVGIAHPPDEHPKRPIQGFACRRREVSGQRLWGWARDAFGTPERFFMRFFVLNYCPLCFLSESGANLALDKLPVASRRSLQQACDRALRSAADALHAQYAVGIGQFAADRIARVLGPSVICGHAPHPSPANPQAGPHWARQMERALSALGLEARA